MADNPQFDVDGARKAGYSDDEIIQHLSQNSGFDVEGATKAGYSKQDIINHLSTPAPAPGSEAYAASHPPIAGVTASTPAGRDTNQDPYRKTVANDPLSQEIGLREAEEPSEEATHKAVTGIGIGAPIMIDPVTATAAAAGGAIGAPIVSGGARRLVGAFGASPETQEKAATVGGWLGGVGGSLLGGGAPGMIEESPENLSIAGFKIRNPLYRAPGGTGAPLPSASEYYENAGAERNAAYGREAKAAENEILQKIVRGGPSSTSSSGPAATGAAEANSPEATMQVGKQPKTPLTPDEIAQRRLDQKVANISAEVRAGLRPSPEEDIQSALENEFAAGEKASRVPQDIRPPRTPTPTYVPEGVPGGPSGPTSTSSRPVNFGKSITAERTLPSTVPERASVPNAGGEAWSMQRRVTPELQDAARRGDPGAIETLRRLNPGWSPVVTPKGSDIESPSMESIRGAAQEPLPPSDKEIPKIERPATGSNGIKASKSITAKTGIQDKFSPEQLKQTDSIIDKLMSEPGMTTQKAQDTAQSLVDRVTSGNSVEKEVAQRNIDRIMSGKMRSAPNIKLNGAERRH